LLVTPANPKPTGQGPKITIADIGTGSGCLAVTLAHTLPDVIVQAVDISPEALAVARQNAARHGVTGKITFVQGDLLEPLVQQTFDVIVSNPPYVSQAELRATSPEVQTYEPHLALLAGTDGLATIRRLLPQAKARLKPNGLLLVEIGSSQGQAVTELAKSAFSQATVTIKQDLAGLDRVLMVQS
jgi:release factor glutamine methyltransferase